MIDTHCHLTYNGLYERVESVVERARSASVDRMITVGTTPQDAQRAVETAGRFEGVFAAIGVHPHYAADCLDRQLLADTIRNLAADKKVVALGEMGLDQHSDDPPLADHSRVLEWQLDLAREIDHLPVIIHNREATNQTLDLLRASKISPERFVFHCFTGDADEMKAVLDFGAMVSFTGIITFKNAKLLAACAAAAPLDRLMVETDSPYLTPEPHRKIRPNEPCYVPHVARFLAGRRSMNEKNFIDQMDANAERFFSLDR